MSKEIELTKGFVAIIDDADFYWISEFSWHVTVSGSNYNKLYAASFIRRQDGVWKNTKMHRLILGVESSFQVDHRNGNGLDNRRSNLRVATILENARNKRKVIGTSSRFKGVSFNKRPGRKSFWKAEIRVNRKLIHLGYHVDEIKAAIAYDRAAKKFFGEFSNLNFSHVASQEPVEESDPFEDWQEIGGEAGGA
jgi:phospholipase C